jgi:mono/diheme cytochrome c family protein
MAAIIIDSCKTTFTTAPTDFKATITTQAIERGKVLVFSSCAGCHYDRTIHKLIGTPIHDVPGIVGKVYSANLTNSRTNGRPPQYSDAQLKYLLKTGINKDGRFIPYMLRPNLADEDVNAIIAYLRSNDPAVTAADTTIGLTHYNIIGKIYMGFTAKPLPYNPGIKLPTNDVAIGKYLVDNIGCFHCHSQSLQKLNYLDIEQTKGYMAGGAKFKDDKGNTVIASNITVDKNTGIGNFNKAQFLKAVKDGEAPNHKLHPPMPKFDKLSDKEVNAIYSYLQSIPAKYHNVHS